MREVDSAARLARRVEERLHVGDGLYVAAAGALARERQLDLLSNNLANVSTDGYRQGRIAFESVLADAAAGATPSTIEYVAPAGASVSPLAGPIRETGRPLDVAIEGDGFFALEGDGGGAPLYTRLGRFTIDGAGRLVTPDGRAVLGPSGPIEGLSRLGAELRIEKNGDLVSGERNLGRILTVRFDAPSRLVPHGALAFAAPPGEVPDPVEASLVPRSIEGSNVSAVATMTELIRVQRAFESMNKAIETYRQMDRELDGDVAA